MDQDTICDLLNYSLIALLIISFIYVLLDQYVSNQNLYDRTILPTGDSRKLSYRIEPEISSDDKIDCPSIFDDPSIYVSFIIPAYNEAKRLPKMLDATLAYLQTRENESFTWEIIIVNDGSKDNTPEIALDYSRKNPNIRLIRQPVNMGKGAAVQTGALHARGQMILMVDADGATEISEFANLERKLLELQLTNREAIVVGSRAHLEEGSKANRDFLRNLLGSAFHSLILLSGVRGIQDTQCGFKLFSREAARWLFPNQHVQRWCFDPELLVIGRQRKMAIEELPVEWNEIDGSLMRFSGMVHMGIDLLRITIFYAMSLWKVTDKAPIRAETNDY